MQGGEPDLVDEDAQRHPPPGAREPRGGAERPQRETRQPPEYGEPARSGSPDGRDDCSHGLSISRAGTRLQAVATSARGDTGYPDGVPLVVMDTAPAAVLGACCDPAVARPRLLVTNIGNFHTLAFRLGPEGI
ncbi:MAG: DUF1786 domain-containing protein, partial [Nitrospirales bacterium]|nr:DUF1786 domain-containing protein [Nitrospirales bacterium]